MAEQFDYIIIGSGSAGSALAYRLGESGKHSILVLEYGGSDAGPLIQMPAALSYPMNMKRYDWGYLPMQRLVSTDADLSAHVVKFSAGQVRLMA